MTPVASASETILLCAFGTTSSEALVAYANIGKIIAQKFPDSEIRWCYTSPTIRKIMKKRGHHWESPSEVLEKLAGESRQQVILQSLHVIPGYEYDDLREVVREYASRFASLSLGEPLVNGITEAQRIVARIVENAPPRETDEALILVGHGTAHAAGLSYLALDALFYRSGEKIFVGVVEGDPSLEDILSRCRKTGISKALLLPFMVVAGDHARNDMGGDAPDSWRSRLTAEGIEPHILYRGLGEEVWVAEIFADHLVEAVRGK